MVVAVVCGLLAIAATAVASGKATAAEYPVTVKSQSTGLCLDNSGAVAASGNSVILWECNAGANQTWTVGDDGRARTQGFCLQPVGGVVAAGRSLQIATCSSSQAQVWWQGSNDTIRPGSANLCLQAGASTATLQSCSGTTAQRWTAAAVATEPVVDTSVSPSGVAAPTGDLTGWDHLFVDEFTKDAAIGSWANACEPNKIVYTGADGQKWRTYPQCYKDTYQKRAYRPDVVLSVTGGALDFYLHPVDGQPAGANPSPLITGSSQYQTYGRYSVRMKVDRPGLNEYYVAFLLWPQSEVWPNDGEFDFPEGKLNSTAGGFHHYSGLGACTACQAVATDIGASFTDWHTYTMEWSPGRIRYLLDGTVVLDSRLFVPAGPMRWQLQAETNGYGSSSGHLLVDWVSVWSYSS